MQFEQGHILYENIYINHWFIDSRQSIGRHRFRKIVENSRALCAETQ
jgi:hypothetical protein